MEIRLWPLFHDTHTHTLVAIWDGGRNTQASKTGGRAKQNRTGRAEKLAKQKREGEGGGGEIVGARWDQGAKGVGRGFLE